METFKGALLFFVAFGIIIGVIVLMAITVIGVSIGFFRFMDNKFKIMETMDWK